MARDFTANNHSVRWGDIDAMDGASKLTLSFWLLPHFTSWPTATTATVMGKHDGVTAGQGHAISRDSLNLAIRMEIENGVDSFASSPAMVDETWVHCHWVYDGTQADETDRIRLWLDALEVALVHSIGDHPATLGTCAQDFCFGRIQEPLWSNGQNYGLAEAVAWTSAITNIANIRKIREGCASLVDLSNQEIDCALFGTDSPEIDRSPNSRSGTVTGTAEIAHPPTVRARASCGGGGGYMAASYYGLVEPPSGW